MTYDETRSAITAARNEAHTERGVTHLANVAEVLLDRVEALEGAVAGVAKPLIGRTETNMERNRRLEEEGGTITSADSALGPPHAEQ